MSSKTASDRFSILRNGIDTRLEIICDTETGFYNITKTAKMVGELGSVPEITMENDAGGNPPASNKCQNAKHWFTNSTTNQLINKCKELTKLDVVHYELAKGTPKAFAGTYVHRKLYDHFLIWLDPTYGMLISDILDKIHQDTNRRLLQEKNDFIRKLTDKIDKQTEQIKELLLRSDIAIIELKETRGELTEARMDILSGNNQINSLTDKVEECREVIVSD